MKIFRLIITMHSQNNLRVLFGIYILFGFILSNSRKDDLESNKKLLSPIFEKFYINLANTKNGSVDSSNAFLTEAMTGVSSSAPREEFIINVDMIDTLLASDPNITLHISMDSQSTWSHFPPLVV